jgi:hypothetical protein
VRPRDVPDRGHYGRQREPEGERHSQGVVGGPGGGARKDRADGDGGPAEDQDEGPDELGYGRAEYVGGVYLAAIESSAPGSLLFLFVESPPCAPTDTLFDVPMAPLVVPDPARRGVAVHAPSAALPNASILGSVAGRSALSLRSSSSPFLCSSIAYPSLDP